MKQNLRVILMLTLAFVSLEAYTQKYMIGFFIEPGLTAKTSTASKLRDNPGGDFVFTTPEGFNLNYKGKYQFQGGIQVRYVFKDWYLQGSVSTLQNFIELKANGIPIPGATLRISTINPAVAVIRRINLRKGIEFNLQLGLQSGFSSLNKREGIYGTWFTGYENGDTINYGWIINMNSMRGRPKLAAQTSVNLMIPLSRNWNFEVGVGFYHELNKPNVVSHSSYYNSTQPNYPFNYNFPYSSYPKFNERYLYLKLGVLRELHPIDRK